MQTGGEKLVGMYASRIINTLTFLFTARRNADEIHLARGNDLADVLPVAFAIGSLRTPFQSLVALFEMLDEFVGVGVFQDQPPRIGEAMLAGELLSDSIVLSGPDCAAAAAAVWRLRRPSMAFSRSGIGAGGAVGVGVLAPHMSHRSRGCARSGRGRATAQLRAIARLLGCIAAALTGRNLLLRI